MNGAYVIPACCLGEVKVELVGIEWSEWSKQLGNGLKAYIQSLVCREFVGAHLLTPEAFAVQSDIPVAEVVVYEILYQSSGTGWVVVVHFSLHTLYQRMQHGKYPSVNLRAFCHWHVWL